MSLWTEIKRRKVIQVGAVYAVVAWLVIQVVVTVEGPLRLPGAFSTGVIVLLVIGFPVALVLAWALELSPSGVARTRALDSRTQHSPAGADSSETPSGQTDVLPNSLAVLPFDNLSPNPDHAYFAAGIHEEILNYLAKIKDINVIARTSVKQYHDTKKPIATIAEELRVGAVMEGSVRYAGDRVRVTAQLVDAVTQNHLWSDVYERDLADVFSIQADIAGSVAEALKAEFTAAEKRSLEELPTTSSSEAHSLYLKAQALYAQGDTAITVTAPHSVRASIQSLLDRAVEQDPEFAHPYALKALLFAVARVYDPIGETEWLARCRELDGAVTFSADKALSLNDNLALPHFALALNHQFNWRWAEGRKQYERAVELRPNDSNILTWYATQIWLMEHAGHAIDLAERAVELDPDSVWAWHILGMLRHVAGDDSGSVDAFDRGSRAHPESPLPYLHVAMAHLALGREGIATKNLKLADELLPSEAAPAIHIHLGYGLGRLGEREDARRKIEQAKRLKGDRYIDPMVWGIAELAVGDSAAALDSFVRAVEYPEYRQEVFGWALVKENWWSDPVLEQSKFVALRARL